MLRAFSKMSTNRDGAFCLLLGTALLLIIYMRKHNTVSVQDVRKDDRQMKPTTRHISASHFWSACQQNMSAATIPGFSSFPGTLKEFLYYRHCRHFPMLLDLPDKCGGTEKSAEVFLLLVIKSSPMNYERREVLRKTWAKERFDIGTWLRRVFIVGTTDSGLEKKRLNELLKLEHREHHDILQWDFTDKFHNLTLKQTLFLEWMERNCRNVRFLLNGDDDVFVNTDNMIEYLQTLKDNDGSKHLFAGNVKLNDPPVRSTKSKYFVPLELYKSDTYPTYCSGGGFFLSGYTAMVIHNMSQSTTFLPVDDVYIGLCLAKAGLSASSHPGMRPAGFSIPSRTLDAYDPCYFKELLLVHRFFPPHMYLMWHRIHDPNLKCGSKGFRRTKH